MASEFPTPVNVVRIDNVTNDEDVDSNETLLSMTTMSPNEHVRQYLEKLPPLKSILKSTPKTAEKSVFFQHEDPNESGNGLFPPDEASSEIGRN